jgi:hypothetical protein
VTLCKVQSRVLGDTRLPFLVEATWRGAFEETGWNGVNGQEREREAHQGNVSSK